MNKNVHALSGSRSGADTINILFEVKTRILASGYSELAFDWVPPLNLSGAVNGADCSFALRRDELCGSNRAKTSCGVGASKKDEA